MKANQLAALALRLMGVLLIVLSIADLSIRGGDITEIVNRQYNSEAELRLLCSASPIVIGILLIACSGLLGEKLAPKSTSAENPLPITFRQIQTLAFAIAGLLIFAEALPELLQSIFYLLRSLSDDSSSGQFSAGMRSMMVRSSIGTILTAALGVWLFFGADGFANFFNPPRNIRLPNPPRE